MKSSLLVVCASLFIVNAGKEENEENNKFRPKSAREAMRHAARIAAKLNAKELASTERSVLIQRVENGQLIEERIPIAKKEEPSKVEEDIKGTEKPPEEKYSKFEDDGNWYRTPQEKQEAFRLARMKKTKMMRKLRAKMLHEGSDEMQVGSAKNNDSWRKSLKELKGKERLERKRNRLKKRRPRSAEDYNENESKYKNDFDLQRFKANFLKDEKTIPPEKEVTYNFEWAKRYGITISTVRVFLDEKHDDVKYIVLKPPPKNWPEPQFYFHHRRQNARYPRAMYTRYPRPTRYYATIPPLHLRRTIGSDDERSQSHKSQDAYIRRAFESFDIPTIPSRIQEMSTKAPDFLQSDERVELPSVEKATEETITVRIKTSDTWKQSPADQGSRYHAVGTSSPYNYNMQYNSYYRRQPGYRRYSYGFNYNYVTRQPRRVITPVQKKLMMRSEFRNELISTTSKAKEDLTTTLMTWPTIHRKKEYEFATEAEYNTPWPNVVINPELKEKSVKSWISRREDWGRRDMWRADAAYDMPYPPGVLNTSSGPDMWRQDDYRQKQSWNEVNYFSDDKNPGGYQQSPYRRQYIPPYHLANRGVGVRPLPYRGRGGGGYGRPFRGRRRYRVDQYATYNEAIEQSSDSSLPYGMESFRPTTKSSVNMSRDVLLGIEIARQWNKLSDPFPQTVSPLNVVTPDRISVGLEGIPDIQQPRTPFSNMRLLQSTDKSQQVFSEVRSHTTQQSHPTFQLQVTTPSPPQQTRESLLRPSYVFTTSRPIQPDGSFMLRPTHIVTTVMPKTDYGASMLRPDYMMTPRISKSSFGSFIRQPSYMMTPRISKSSFGSFIRQPSYMMTTRVSKSSDGFSMLRPSYLMMTTRISKSSDGSSMFQPSHMRSSKRKHSDGPSLLRPSYMDDAEGARVYNEGVTEGDMEARKVEEGARKHDVEAKEDEIEQRRVQATTYRRYFERTRRQRLGRRRFNYLRRQEYQNRDRSEDVYTFRFENETMEVEGTTEDLEKLQMEYLGIGRQPQNEPIITVAPKEGYNQLRRKLVLGEESLSSVESVKLVYKLHGQRLKTKEKPVIAAKPYMPASLMSDSEEEPKKSEKNEFRTQVTVPPVKPRTTIKRTGGTKSKMKRGQRSKNKVTFKYTKPVSDMKWKPYNRYDAPYTFRYTIAPTAIG